MVGGHYHWWRPWSPYFTVVGPWFYWNGPYDPFFWSYWPYYSFYYRSYYPSYYAGGRYYRTATGRRRRSRAFLRPAGAERRAAGSTPAASGWRGMPRHGPARLRDGGWRGAPAGSGAGTRLRRGGGWHRRPAPGGGWRGEQRRAGNAPGGAWRGGAPSARRWLAWRRAERRRWWHGSAPAAGVASGSVVADGAAVPTAAAAAGPVAASAVAASAAAARRRLPRRRRRLAPLRRRLAWRRLVGRRPTIRSAGGAGPADPVALLVMNRMRRPGVRSAAAASDRRLATRC